MKKKKNRKHKKNKKKKKKKNREKLLIRFFPNYNMKLQLNFWAICFFSNMISIHAHVHQIGNLLHGSGMAALPNGSYENVKLINFLNNNFNVLESYTFYKHGLYNLEKAILRNNYINHINPNAFSMMPKVLQLDLYGNKLITFDKNSFSGLESLEILRLGNNTIASIDPDVLKPLHSLQTLDLSQNFLTTLRQDLLRETSLSELNLQGNPLVFEENGGILECPTLTNLNLQSCNLVNLPEDAFKLLPNLEALDLSRNKLRVLPEDLLKQLAHLKYLDISFNFIKHLDVGMFHLPTNLDVLYCNGNPLADGLDCTQLLVSIHGIHNSAEAGNVEGQYVDEDLNQPDDPVKEHEGTFAPEVTEDEEGSTDEESDGSNSLEEKNSESIQTSKDSAHDSTKWIEGYTVISEISNFDDADNAIVYSIMIVSIICLILLAILLIEIYYLMRQYEKRDQKVSLDF